MVRRLSVLCLLLFSTSASLAAPRISDEQKEAFRKIKLVKLELDQSYKHPNRRFRLPVETMVSSLLHYAGVETAKGRHPKSDGTLRIVVKGEIIGSAQDIYSPVYGMPVSNFPVGATLRGSLSLEAPGVTPFATTFDGSYDSRVLDFVNPTGEVALGYWSLLLDDLLPEVTDLLWQLYGTDPLLAALKDKDPLLELAVIAELDKTADPIAVDPLIGMLKAEKVDVRKAAARALGNIGDPRAVDPLIGMLHDKEPNPRAVAATALGKLRDRRAVQPLIDRLKDSQEKNRDYFVKALTALTGQDFGDAASRWQTWWDEAQATTPSPGP